MDPLGQQDQTALSGQPDLRVLMVPNGMTGLERLLVVLALWVTSTSTLPQAISTKKQVLLPGP